MPAQAALTMSEVEFAALDTKQRFVIATYELMNEVGLQNLTVRDVAKRVGCTAAALYKHFESFDYLISLAAIRALGNYPTELLALARYNSDPLTIEQQGWRCFCDYAFDDPQVFLHLFWGPLSDRFGEILDEYLQMFPPLYSKGVEGTEYYTRHNLAMSKGSLRQRDFYWLEQAAEQGLITMEDAEYVSKVGEHIAHSMLMNHASHHQDEESTARAKEECNELIDKLISGCRIT